MGDVKRYDINAYLGEEGWMEEDRHGQYVEYTDYAKLEAALSSAPQGWRPIETAPKDGTPFLVPMPSVNYPNAQAIAKWVENDKCCWTDGNQRVSPKVWHSLPAAPKSLASERQA